MKGMVISFLPTPMTNTLPLQHLASGYSPDSERCYRLEQVGYSPLLPRKRSSGLCVAVAVLVLQVDLLGAETHEGNGHLILANTDDKHWPRAIRLIQNGVIDLSKLVTHRYSLENALQAFDNTSGQQWRP
jgi:hypothetical protein